MRVKDDLGHAAAVVFGLRREGIVERLANALFDVGFAVDRHRSAQVVREDSQVVQAEQVVGMIVRIERGMDPPDPLAQQLPTQVGGGVDQQVSAGQPQDDARPRAAVAWVAARASVAVAADHRHADRSAGAEEEQLPL